MCWFGKFPGIGSQGVSSAESRPEEKMGLGGKWNVYLQWFDVQPTSKLVGRRKKIGLHGEFRYLIMPKVLA